MMNWCQRGIWKLHYRKDSILVTGPNGEAVVWDEKNPAPLIMPNHPCDPVTTSWDRGCMPFSEISREAWNGYRAKRLRRISGR